MLRLGDSRLGLPHHERRARTRRHNQQQRQRQRQRRASAPSGQPQLSSLYCPVAVFSHVTSVSSDGSACGKGVGSGGHGLAFQMQN